MSEALDAKFPQVSASARMRLLCYIALFDIWCTRYGYDNCVQVALVGVTIHDIIISAAPPQLDAVTLQCLYAVRQATSTSCGSCMQTMNTVCLYVRAPVDQLHQHDQQVSVWWSELPADTCVMFPRRFSVSS
jgi:hypothetical protein